MPGGGLLAASEIAAACPATRIVMLTVSEDEDEYEPDVRTVATTPGCFMLVKKDDIISLTAPVRSTSRVCVCVDLIGEQGHCGLRMHDPTWAFPFECGCDEREAFSSTTEHSPPTGRSRASLRSTFESTQLGGP